MSSEEARHENGPIKICGKFGQFGVGGGDEEADSALPPVRTPGSISKEQVPTHLTPPPVPLPTHSHTSYITMVVTLHLNDPG